MTTNSITLKDLAAVIGVSISTVSKSLSDSYEISSSTKEKVLKVAKSLNYRPNPLACSLRNRRSLILGVILPDLKDQFFLNSLNGITEESYKNEYKIMAYQSCNNYDKEIEYTNLLFESNIIDGLIFSSTKKTLLPEECNHLENFINKGIPIIYLTKTNKTSIHNSHYGKGFETGKSSVKELLSKIKELQLNISA